MTTPARPITFQHLRLATDYLALLDALERRDPDALRTVLHGTRVERRGDPDQTNNLDGPDPVVESTTVVE